MRFPNLDRLLDRIGSLAMILAAAVLLWVVLDERPPDAPGPLAVQELEVPINLDPPRPTNVRGSSSARVAILEFSDFECPFCARHARQVYPRVAGEYVDTGKVQYIFRHYPLDIHPFAVQAATAAECASRHGLYWEMHDKLFEANGALSESHLVEYAASLDLQPADFETCLADDMAVRRVMEDRRQGAELGVTSTPTFFFAEVREDGSLSLLAKLSGALPYSVFQTTLDELLSAIESRVVEGS